MSLVPRRDRDMQIDLGVLDALHKRSDLNHVHVMTTQHRATAKLLENRFWESAMERSNR